MESLWLMFSGAFLAATLLPGGSEVLLAALLANTPTDWLALWLAASVGNTLGSLTSFALGWFGRMAKTPEQLASSRYQRSLRLVQKYGVWSLLLAWAPVIGDLLCVLAGWLRLPLLPSVVLFFVGKTLRYLLVTAAVLHWS
ncbi:YqaA family protein [Shewanella sp. GXUN23E]|uniref:YqaA family protein n=1 Tax=Shewanella sp. GXUN23E TaxID=3422498 RepID=UPI003D7D1892